LPAVAFSTGSPFDHRTWAKQAWADSSTALWEGVAELAADVLRDILEAGYPEGVDVLSVNMPDGAGLDAPRRVTTLAKVGYDNIFREHEPGRFIHDFYTGLRMSGDLEGSDVEVLRSGGVTITPIQLAHTGTVPDSFRRAVERN
jgi:broad specificity polyphosphatase/5'/3'-nucleotidase SurE